jgi:hypothetical protein
MKGEEKKRNKKTYQLVNDEFVVVFVHDERSMMDWKVDYEHQRL